MDSISCPPALCPHDAGPHSDPEMPLQSGALLQLPTEILLQIMEDESLGRQDLKSFALTSARLFGLARPAFYRANSYETFRRALKAADVDMMDRCEKFEAAPKPGTDTDTDTDTEWSSTVVGCQCRYLEHRVHRPVDIVLESLVNNEALTESCHDALVWLLDRNHSAERGPEERGESIGPDDTDTEPDETDTEPGDADTEPEDTEPDNTEPDETKYMSAVLPNLLQKGSSTKRVEGICRIIRLLKDRGLEMPFDLYLPKLLDDKNEPEPARGDPWWDVPLDTVTCMSAVTLAMKSHCPPSFLEFVLRGFEGQARQLAAHDKLQLCPEQIECCARCVPWEDAERLGLLGFTDVDVLLANLHADLLYPSTRWSESYPGEVADIFEEKLNLLVRYKAATEAEQRLLSSILGALREMGAMSQASGGLDRGRDEKDCWVRLWMSVAPFAAHPETVDQPVMSYSLLAMMQKEYLSQPEHRPQRLHRFLFHKDHNPWQVFFKRQARKKDWKEWGEPNKDRYKELLHESLDWAAAIQARSLYPTQAWHQMRLDEFLALMDILCREYLVAKEERKLARDRWIELMSRVESHEPVER
ncbi:hypothetical protein ACJ41O_014103 [Fusarium nematophilum]